MMKIKKVKVGYKTYKIDKYEHQVNHAHYGFTDHVKGLIAISEPLSKDDAERKNTLLHEVLHGICYVYNIGLEHEEEERIVTTIANGLIQVLQDNPKLLEELS